MYLLNNYVYTKSFYLSLMMALIERYPNAWHMLIERQYFSFKLIMLKWCTGEQMVF